MAKEDDNDPVKFDAPEGFSLPDGVNADEPFQSMATVQQNDDGTLTLLELDGQQVGGPSDSDSGDDEDTEPNPSATGAGMPMTGSAGTAMLPKKRRKMTPKSMSDVVAMRFGKMTGK